MEEKKMKPADFQSEYNTFNAIRNGSFSYEEAKFYLRRMHEETSFTNQKLLAEAVIFLAKNNPAFNGITAEWKMMQTAEN